MDLQELRTRWNDDIQGDPALDDEGCERLLAWQIERGVSFGDRPLCSVLRPEFITPRELTDLNSICARVTSAIRKVRILLTDGPDWAARLELAPSVLDLVEIDPGFERLGTTTRLDAFEAGGAFSFVELNAEAPAGIAYHDVLVQMFESLSAMDRLRERARVRPLRVLGWLLQALLTTYNEWGRGAGKPRIAVVDWRESPTSPEFHLLAEAWVKAGYPTIVADPRDLELRGGRLYAGDFRIDLVYRRVLVADCARRTDDVQALVEAVRQRAVCMVNPFRAVILHRKRLFAELTDPNSPLTLSPAERAVVEAHVPWTRVVRETSTPGMADDSPIDLVPFIRTHREMLVLKPDDDYGGHGVHLGWKMDEAAWDEAIQQALDVPYVVQRRIPVRTLEFPVLSGARTMKSFLVDRDPYVFRGRMGGFLTRLASGELANVTAGGGMVPTFVVDFSG